MGLYAVITVIGAVWIAVMLIRQQRADNRRLEASRLEANRLIDEYEKTYGAGSSPFSRIAK